MPFLKSVRDVVEMESTTISEEEFTPEVSIEAPQPIASDSPSMKMMIPPAQFAVMNIKVRQVINQIRFDLLQHDMRSEVELMDNRLGTLVDNPLLQLSEAINYANGCLQSFKYNLKEELAKVDPGMQINDIKHSTRSPFFAPETKYFNDTYQLILSDLQLLIKSSFGLSEDAVPFSFISNLAHTKSDQHLEYYFRIRIDKKLLSKDNLQKAKDLILNYAGPFREKISHSNLTHMGDIQIYLSQYKCDKNSITFM